MAFKDTLQKINELVAQLEEVHETDIIKLQSRIDGLHESLTAAGISKELWPQEETVGYSSQDSLQHGRSAANLAGLTKWDAMQAAEMVDKRKSTWAEVVKMERTASKIDSEKTAFLLKDGWTRVPSASDSFLDEVDSMLVERSAKAMVDMRQSKASSRVSHVASRQRRVSVRMSIAASRLLPILDPSSPKRLLWDISGMMLISYDMVSIPILLSFDPEPDVFTTGMGWMTLLFWTIDMGCSVQTGFIRDGVLIMKQKAIVINYLKGWFWVDCVVVVPDWVMKAMGSVTNAAGLGRVFRVARVFRVLRLLRLLKLKRLFAIVYDMIDSEVMFIWFNLVKLLFIIIFMNHGVACAWFLVGKIGRDTGAPKNWLEHVGDTPVWGKPLAWQYLTSLHWSITQFTPASMDIYATNVGERLFSVVILFWALVALSSIIGSVSASMTALRNMSADENKNVWLLRRYLKQIKISRHLTNRILTYVDFKSVGKHKVNAGSVKLLSSLSDQFHSEIAYEIYSPYLGDHPFFSYMAGDETMMKSMHRLCRAALKVMSCAEEEHVFSLGDEGKQMFFVKGGSLQYTLVDGSDLDTPLTSKLWASEAVLWTTWRHRGFLKARTPSEVLSVDPEKFSEVMHLHPKPWYLGMHYGVDFVNFLNRTPANGLTDVIFDAEVWVTVVNESDTYVLKRRQKEKEKEESDEDADSEHSHESSHSLQDGADSAAFSLWADRSRAPSNRGSMKLERPGEMEIAPPALAKKKKSSSTTNRSTGLSGEHEGTDQGPDGSIDSPTSLRSNEAMRSNEDSPAPVHPSKVGL